MWVTETDNDAVPTSVSLSVNPATVAENARATAGGGDGDAELGSVHDPDDADGFGGGCWRRRDRGGAG